MKMATFVPPQGDFTGLDRCSVVAGTSSISDRGKLVALKHGGHCEVVRRAPGRRQKINFVLDDQLFLNLHRVAGLGLIIELDKFDRALHPRPWR
jgi:hypothetical protein